MAGSIATPSPTAKILTPTVTASPTPTVTIMQDPPGGPTTNGTGGGSGGGSLEPVGGGSQVGNVVTVTPEPPAPEPPAEPEPPLEPEPPVVEPEPEEPAPPIEPEPEPEPEEINEMPFVTGSTPDDGVNKQQPGVDITVTFSEAMDQAPTEAAFSTNPAVDGTFSWNAEGTEMTFAPSASIPYNTLVQWQVASFAQDVEGLEMGEDYSAGFSILEQTTVTLYSLDERDGHAGYVGNPPMGPFPVVQPGGNTLYVGYQTRGFLTFDLSELPADTQKIVGAELEIRQASHSAGAYGAATGSLWITSVAYGTLDFADYFAPAVEICWPACAAVSYLLSENPADGWKSADVSKFVQRDWKLSKGDLEGEQAEPGQEWLSQMRLQFQKENINVPGIHAEFYAGEAGNSSPRLQVTIVH